MCCGCGVVWQVRTLTGHSDAVCSAAFSPNGEFIVSGSVDGFVKIWDAVTGAEVSSLWECAEGFGMMGMLCRVSRMRFLFFFKECGLEPPMFAFFLAGRVLQVV